MSNVQVQQPRKPVQRAFSRRLVGLPPEPEAIPVQPESAGSSVVQAQATVDQLLEAVAAAKTYDQVKQALHDTFNPSEAPASPVKRPRGRPRVWSSDAERKRSERATAANNLAALLAKYHMTIDTEIPPGLKTKFGITVDTYGQLLKQDGVAAKVFKDLLRELKLNGDIRKNRKGAFRVGGDLPGTNTVFSSPGTSNDAPPMVMHDAPQGKGRVVTGDYDSAKADKIQGIRQQQERELSRPGDEDEFLDIPRSSLSSRDELPAGDRRRVQPKGHGPDDDDDNDE